MSDFVNLEHQARLKSYRITSFEYEKICNLLGRAPKPIEWPLFSALWSEHCSYKSSKIHLKKFAKTLNHKVLNSMGENAGIVDLGFGERIAFKMESHNHPSFIEPYQGAATGVGGILRDVFTMGARPIASADYLCFGEIKAPRMKFLVDGVVRGIGGYGNCVGVPTVSGQTEFHSSYNNNILVNAMSVGYFTDRDPIALSAAKGVGNFVVYVGAKTGKDGVHGASMASESFGDDTEKKKPNVQIGDPYFEKLLIESCLEVIRAGLVVSIQDMGAAGLTSSSFEMASKGQVGMNLRLDQVPVRDRSITPEEILLSESQERMLLVCEPDKFEAIHKIFLRWGLDASIIGEIVQERRLHIFWKDELLTEIDPHLLVENAPLYDRKYETWKETKRKDNWEQPILPVEKMPAFVCEGLGKIQFGSRHSIYEQYDQRVGGATARGCDQDVALLRLPSSGRGLSIAVGCRPAVMRMDAKLGGLDAIFYPALQMAIKGAEIQAITDCLNFGNPEKPHIMSEFVASLESICDASLLLEAPVISGNVSFYNETNGVNITSTPATGMIGLRKDVNDIPGDCFSSVGSFVYLVRMRGIEAELLQDGELGGFRRSLDLIKFKDSYQRVLNFFKNHTVLSSGMVGLRGRLLELAKQCRGGVGVRVLESFIKELSNPNYYFYEFYMELEKSLADKSLFGREFEIFEVGITKEEKLEFTDRHFVSVSEINSSLNRGLAPVFEASI